MLRSWTAPLYQTLTTTQRLHIIWRSVPWSEAPPPTPSPQTPLQKTKRCSFLNKPDIKWESTAVYNRCWDVCSYTASVHTTQPETQSLVSCAGLLLGDAELFGVTKKGKPLCKSPLWVPPTIGGGGRVSLKTLQPHLGNRCMRGKTLGNTEVHIMLFK